LFSTLVPNCSFAFGTFPNWISNLFVYGQLKSAVFLAHTRT
jgi:hypothetical protein